MLISMLLGKIQIFALYRKACWASGILVLSALQPIADKEPIDDGLK
jgi:hypothetical protein